MAKNLQLYRNDVLFGSKTEAVNSLIDELKISSDGELVLVRYEKEDGEVASILGVAYVSSEKSSFTIYEESPLVGVSENYETVEVPNLSDSSFIYEQIVGGDTLDVAVHKLEKGLMDSLIETIRTEYVLSQALTKINESAGFNKNGNYVPTHSVLNGIDNVADAIDVVASYVDEVANAVPEMPEIPETTISEDYEVLDAEKLANTTFVYNEVKHGDNLDQAVYKIEKGFTDLVVEMVDNELVIAQALTSLKDAVGLNVDSEYIPNKDIEMLSGVETIADAIEVLAMKLDEMNIKLEEINVKLSDVESGIDCGSFE